MARFTISVHDSATLEALAKLTALASFQIQQTALINASMVMERELKQTLGRHGRTNSAMVTISRGPRKGERTKRWLGPSPGGPDGSPGIFTGATRASVSHSRVTRGLGGYRISIGPTTIYARRLDSIHPFMEPAMAAAADRVRTAYIDTVRRFLP